MVLTLSKHGPNMVPKSRHSMNMDLKPCQLSLKNFRALAGLEVELGKTWSKHGSNMALAWFLKIDTPSKGSINYGWLILKVSAL